MRRYLIFLLFIAFCFNRISAQDKGTPVNRLLFQGLVMDAVTQAPLSGSQIIINRSFSSISDFEGRFAFYVVRGDTVKFMRLGYKTQTYLVGDTLRGKEFIAGIYMQTDTLLIGEVVIVPRLVSLKSELYNPRTETNQQMENARYNLEISAYQGRITTGRLGDPFSNYEILRQKQRQEAYEKGGIPSDKIVGLSPLLLIPAAYLLMNGLPGKPDAPVPQITRQEIEQLNRKYLETYRKNK